MENNKIDRNKLARYMGWGTGIAVFLGLMLNGTFPARWIDKNILGYSNEVRKDINKDGLEDIILIDKRGAGIIYKNTGLPFPEYMQTGYIFSSNNK